MSTYVCKAAILTVIDRQEMCVTVCKSWVDIDNDLTHLDKYPNVSCFQECKKNYKLTNKYNSTRFIFIVTMTSSVCLKLSFQKYKCHTVFKDMLYDLVALFKGA